MLLLLIGVAIPSLAQTLTTLATFTSTYNQNSTLIQGTDGNFYGTTETGGANSSGTFFKLTPGGALTTLYSFGNTAIDGINPAAGIIQANDGNFYGTTDNTIFKITPGGTLTTLYTSVSANNDGSFLDTTLVQAKDGNFYGTGVSGGANRLGSVFKITPAGAFTTLYSFTTADGQSPQAALVQASDGNFYGTTKLGGANKQGTVFRITPGGTLTTLYSFNITSGTPDGGLLTSGLTLGADGNLYGTTPSGGAHRNGTVFKMTLSGTLTTLYAFGTTPTDGGVPNGALIQGADGNFYGTNSGGEDDGGGTIFKITPGGTLTPLYTFTGCSSKGCYPEGTLIQASNGSLYGTTIGSPDTVFSLTLPAATSPCTNTTPPVITSIDSASAYGGYNYFASGTWLEIKGTNMADPTDPRLSAATNPGQWTSSDFNGSNAPTSLDGISVSINGKPAYVWYLSTGQLNVQAPEDTATGNVAITVTNCNAASPMYTFARRALAPGFLAPTNYSANGEQYMVATFQSDGAYVLNTATGAAFGLNSRPAKPGDGIIAYGVGFGDVTPSILPGVIAGASNTLVNPVTISFGTTKAAIAYQGLAGGFVGLYEFYFTVPTTLANGDYQIEVTQNGTTVPQTMYLTVHN